MSERKGVQASCDCWRKHGWCSSPKCTKKTDIIIDKVVLPAPAGGVGIASESIKKMFVASEDEALFSSVNRIFDESSQLKKLKVHPGSFYAQHMFKAEYCQ